METRRNSGFSLVEVVFSIATSVAVLGSALLMTISLSRSTGQLRASDDLFGDVRRAVHKISDVLEPTVAALANPAVLSPLHTSWLQVQAPPDLATGVPGAIHVIRREPSPSDPDDGVDNDGNGLIDEGLVVWIRNPGDPDEERIVLCRDVSESLEGEVPGNGLDDNGNDLIDEGGLAFDFPPGFPLDRSFVRIQLSLSRLDREGRPMTVSAQRVVSFMN